MIADQVPRLGEALALDRVVENLEGRPQRSAVSAGASRMRRARFSKSLLLMTIALPGGARARVESLTLETDWTRRHSRRSESAPQIAITISRIFRERV
jgi:hypothetical protein